MEQITVIVDEKIAVINPNIYGHFTEHIGGVIYDGIWVGPDSKVPNIDGFRLGIIEAMKHIKAPVIRYPGGCFAETYNWRDGIGPVEQRPVTTNWWYNHDSRLEANRVGTAEFMKFCNLIGAEPYMAANITSTTALEVRNWVDYCNMPADSTSLAQLRGQHGNTEPFGIRYWGIGNENWGGGGNMIPEDYAGEYRRYATAVNSLPGSKYLVACGPNGNDTDWTQRFFRKISDRIPNPSRILQGYSAHFYCGSAGTVLGFDKDEWYQLLSQASGMEPLITQQRAIMDSYDPKRRIGLIIDEWGCWHPDGSGPSAGKNLFEQQVTMRDAIVSAITLNIFNNHSDKVVMGNVAQLVNNLHALFLSSEDNLIQTPNYHVFDMFKGHQGNTAVRSLVETDEVEFDNKHRNRKDQIATLSCSTSVSEKTLTLTLANLRYDDACDIRIQLRGATAGGLSKKAELRADDPHSHNTFEAPDTVEIDWSEVELVGDSFNIDLNAASVVMLEIPLV